jgi:hypothetical protein
VEVKIDFDKIKDWDTFHEVFAETMGFPDFYGKNNNAWIDCMSYIDDKEAGMSKIYVEPGERLDIVVSGTEKAIESTPEVFLGFMEIVADVNQRFIESGTQTRVNIIAT